MRIVPTLLRVILALSLVLNGTGLATAHAAVADATAPAALQEAPVDEAPCHEAPDPGVTGHGSHDSKAGFEVEKAGGIDHHAGTDCCDMGSCDNACPQPLSAALIAATMTGSHARPDSLPQAMAGSRPGPLLPHPIRPPIA